MSGFKSVEIDGLEVYFPEDDRSSNTRLIFETEPEALNFRPTIFALSLALFFLITTSVFFWILYAKFQSIYFLINAIILSVFAVFTILPLSYFSYNQKHMQSMIFNETSHTKNKEMLCFLFILIELIYLGTLSFMNLPFFHLYQFQSNLKTGSQTNSQNSFDVFTAEGLDNTVPLRYLSIPCLISFVFLALSLINIISNVQFKFTMNLMSLNLILISSFAFSLVGIIQHIFLVSTISENDEILEIRKFKFFIYFFVASIVILFANCVQVAIKRKGVLVIFGLALFVIAVIGLAFTGIFFRGFRNQITGFANLKPDAVITTFQQQAFQKICDSNWQKKSKACLDLLFFDFLEKNFAIGFYAVIVFGFMLAGSVFNFALAKEDQDPPTNFILFTFVFIMVGILVAFLIYLIKFLVG